MNDNVVETEEENEFDVKSAVDYCQKLNTHIADYCEQILKANEAKNYKKLGELGYGLHNISKYLDSSAYGIRIYACKKQEPNA